MSDLASRPLAGGVRASSRAHGERQVQENEATPTRPPCLTLVVFFSWNSPKVIIPTPSNGLEIKLYERKGKERKITKEERMDDNKYRKVSRGSGECFDPSHVCFDFGHRTHNCYMISRQREGAKFKLISDLN